MSNKMLMNIFSLKEKKKSSCSHVKKKILLILRFNTEKWYCKWKHQQYMVWWSKVFLKILKTWAHGAPPIHIHLRLWKIALEIRLPLYCPVNSGDRVTLEEVREKRIQSAAHRECWWIELWKQLASITTHYGSNKVWQWVIAQQASPVLGNCFPIKEEALLHFLRANKCKQFSGWEGGIP